MGFIDSSRFQPDEFEKPFVYQIVAFFSPPSGRRDIEYNPAQGSGTKLKSSHKTASRASPAGESVSSHDRKYAEMGEYPTRRHPGVDGLLYHYIIFLRGIHHT